MHDRGEERAAPAAEHVSFLRQIRLGWRSTAAGGCFRCGVPSTLLCGRELEPAARQSGAWDGRAAQAAPGLAGPGCGCHSTRPPFLSTACTSQSMAMRTASSRSLSSAACASVALHMSVLQTEDAGGKGAGEVQ